ncbi:hypothetical protein B0I35DRAFT_31013 [Stachybotrys elegans]|uniref:CAP-Gly domain-containing protein n=1 Tax=Stachybotrys elegans TaxID=80388 RepID=A0A8K0T858_9HYPO|nr:hypothetical protein B0I35DRAFT_31013 [Stachybotrys elegans]
MVQSHHIGQRLSYDGALCTVRYIGEVAGQSGSWLGVEWDDASRGKHNGSHKGTRYFACVSNAPTAASFVRPTRPADKPQSFIKALHEKYASEPLEEETKPQARIIISGTKVAEEMGFDKIRRKLAQVKELKIVLLDGLRIDTPTSGEDAAIADTCPSIKQLDMSRNLLESLDTVEAICRELPALKILRLSGNRFAHISEDETPTSGESAFKHVEEISLEENFLGWEGLCKIARKCPSLATMNVGTNQLSLLPAVNYLHLSSTLTSINLEFNEFTTLWGLGGLQGLHSLRDLHLKGNNISELAPEGSEAPIFPNSLQFLDLSYNNVQSWGFVDRLSTHFPGLAALRLTHNPVYDKHETDSKASSSEETHMFTVARIAGLKSLNFTHITHADRTNAEMFYLSRIARQLAGVPESAETPVLAQHPRYAELCEVYGEPYINRQQEVNPSFLEARLVRVTFHRSDGDTKTTRIPKSSDIYAVKGIAGRLFGLQPLTLRLVWETGEWDPVGGFDDKDGDSSDEEDLDAVGVGKLLDTDLDEDAEKTAGRWVKREVVLKDGPRQLGYCVDGLNVMIRIEV